MFVVRFKKEPVAVTIPSLPKQQASNERRQAEGENIRDPKQPTDAASNKNFSPDFSRGTLAEDRHCHPTGVKMEHDHFFFTVDSHDVSLRHEFYFIHVPLELGVSIGGEAVHALPAMA